MPRKTEVYSWRVSPETRAGLEEVARESRRTVAEVLDAIVTERLRDARPDEAEAETQRRLHARAAQWLGCLSGGGAARSRQVRQLVRTRLERRHGRAR
jgi:hypothetical protein